MLLEEEFSDFFHVMNSRILMPTVLTSIFIVYSYRLRIIIQGLSVALQSLTQVSQNISRLLYLGRKE
jgi:hypothetical protein